ncbi:adenylosuccinate synthase [Sphingobacterium chuzhouense]|uniref:Adenylosuccinate synthetase n=1 Tax=Sphingobacterium chuzhouense TaxID=1742264 RepID=A0ABR7XTV9_9SPHI|nr:adenylosuccinate synthase [Sphingobacterium chuzhouense]MBD1422014.1 adenylosuccinate synthase [Sphingobacterium chuzhouense]
MDILIGLQWGDEGKGKIIDLISRDYDIIARFNGGANAGHSIYHKGKRITLKLLPSGIFYPHIKNIIGTGVVIDPIALQAEVEQLQACLPDTGLFHRILVSAKAHLVLPTYKYWDIYFEESPEYRTIGTTKNGIAPTYSNKILRQNIRVGDILSKNFEAEVFQILAKQYLELQALGQDMPMLQELYDNFLEACNFLKKTQITDTEIIINEALRNNKKVLAEGAQATLLDIDHGSYPYVTSSNTIASAACVGLGVSPKLIDKIYGVTKAYCTRVGKGIFPTEITGSPANELRKKGDEFGSNTKRPRRVGWLDLPALKYAIMLNGVTDLVLTKADILNGMSEVPICTAYERDGETRTLVSPTSVDDAARPVWKFLDGWNTPLGKINQQIQVPKELKLFISFLEEELKISVKYLSTGPQREELIILGN